MQPEEFTALLPKLRPYTDYLYFHLMGEPLLHPELETFLALAGQAGFRVILTTNGTLLEKQQEILLAAPGLHKMNISLHAFEANDLSQRHQKRISPRVGGNDGKALRDGGRDEWGGGIFKSITIEVNQP